MRAHKYVSLKWLAVLLALLPLLNGCRTVDTVSREDPIAVPNPIQDRRVSTDSTLARNISVISVNEDVVSGDLRRIQVRLHNTSSRDRAVRYRFEWNDANGMFIDSASSVWRIQNIKGGETVILSSVAPNQNAVDFNLKLQRN